MRIEMLKIAIAAWFALTISSTGTLAEPAGADEASISQLLHTMFDKSNETVAVEPVLVAGDYAVADWAQGQMGGRALLRRQHQSWTLILCAGDGIKSREALARVGVPATGAQKLESDMIAAEAKLAPERVAMLSRFEGLVRMDGKETATHHPHH